MKKKLILLLSVISTLMMFISGCSLGGDPFVGTWTGASIYYQPTGLGVDKYNVIDRYHIEKNDKGYIIKIDRAVLDNTADALERKIGIGNKNFDYDKIHLTWHTFIGNVDNLASSEGRALKIKIKDKEIVATLSEKDGKLHIPAIDKQGEIYLIQDKDGTEFSRLKEEIIQNTIEENKKRYPKLENVVEPEEENK